jgi:hypothetical protein
VNVTNNEGVTYPSTLNVKVQIRDENIVQFFGPAMRIFRNFEGIFMKSCVYSEGFKVKILFYLLDQQ